MLQYVALAALAGFFLPLQALINARTSGVLGGPLLATLINFGGGAIALTLLLIATRTPMPSLDQVGRIPLYAWFTGLAGVFFVAQAAFTIPKLGAAAMVAIVIAGQLLASVLFDHFGVLQQSHPISWEKIIGIALLLVGVWLILKPAQ